MREASTRRGETADHPPLTAGAVHRTALETGAFWPTAGGLVFLLFMVIPAWQVLGPLGAVAVTALAMVFGVLYLYSVGLRVYPLRVRLLWLGGIWLVVLLLTALLHEDIVFMVMYVVIVHAVLLPWRSGRVAVVVLGLVGLAVSIHLGEQFALFLSIAGVLFALMLGFGIQKSALEAELDRVEQRNAVLAVAAERERIGRDLHDILGHSLTTITVSSQLARRLVEADPDAARERIAEIERISRQALADVRATASGMQQVRAAGEIASARSVLTAAGIDVEAPVALPVLPDDRAELFGYVIREGVTNVVRHARASRCRLDITPASATVADDGVGIPAARSLTGLAGLHRRVEEAGGTLTIDAGPSGVGTVLRAALPDAADAAAATAGGRR